MLTLYDISKGLRSVLSRLEIEEDPEAYDELLKALDKTLTDREEKLSGCCAYIKNLRAEIETYETEIEKLKKQLSILRNKEERFAEYVANCIGTSEEWRNGVHKIGWRESHAIEITNFNVLPLPYIRMKAEPDKALIKQDLKNGATIPGATMIAKKHLQIG